MADAPGAVPDRTLAGLEACWLPVVTGCGALALYVATLAPGVLWSDSAKHLIFVANGDLLGFGHGRHPLHTLVGMGFAHLPLPFPYTQNLLSAVCGAIAVALVAASAQRLAPPRAAALAAGALAVSQTFWHYSVVNESYSMLWALLAAATLFALRHRESGRSIDLALFGLSCGLGMAAHGLALLAVPGLALVAARRPRPAAVPLAALAFAAGSTLIWLPGLIGHTGEAREGIGFVRSTVEHAQLFLEGGKLFRELAAYPLYLGYQFPGLSVLAVIAGLSVAARGRDRLTALGLVIAALPIIVFAAGYFRQRQFAMLGASYLLLTPLLAAGLERLLVGRWARLLALSVLLLPPACYYAATHVVRATGLPFPVRDLPYRDEIDYFLWPSKRSVTGAQRYLAEARSLPAGSTIIADFNPGEALRYAIEVDRSLDLRLLLVIDDLIYRDGDPGPALAELLTDELRSRPGTEVFLADRYEPYYRLSSLEGRFQLETRGAFTKVSFRGRDRL